MTPWYGNNPFGSAAKARSRPRQLYKVNQPKAMTMIMQPGVCYCFGYQVAGADSTTLAGRTIRHLKIHVHAASPQDHPEVEISFDGQGWFGMHEEESFVLSDLYVDKFYMRVEDDDVTVSLIVVYAQEFMGES